MVLIKGKTLSHKIYEINVEPETTISVVKEKFSEVLDTKLSMYDYKLIHLGRVMEDTDVITEEHDSKLFIIMTTKKKVEELKPEIKPTIKPIAPVTAPSPALMQNIPSFTWSTNITGNSVTVAPSVNNLLSSLLTLSGTQSQSTTHQSIMNEINLLNNILTNPAYSNQLFGSNEILSILGNNQDISNNLINSVTEHNEADDDIVDGDDNVEEEDDEGEVDEDNSMPPHEPSTSAPVIPTPAVAPSSDTSFNTQMIGNFSQKDIDNINEIVEMGFDYYEVLQMYTASGKDKDAALNLLFEGQ